MLRRVGVPYALISRDWMINERMQYLTDWAVNLPGKLRVLDAGCGSGLAFAYLAGRCSAKISYYAGIDIDTSRLRWRYRGSSIPHDFVDADLDSSWRLGGFDLVFASEVIEHLIDDRRLFANLFEHLTEKGVLVITTPNKTFVQRIAQVLPGFDAVSSTQDGGHVRVGYDPEELLYLARAYPLRLISQSYIGRINFRELKRRNALRDQSDFVNTARFNPSWLIRRALRIENVAAQDQCWSLAVAFQRCDR
jgi:2-polyprenyl-3-methyl-5-hydroxy-6-metoxy-1,4-benzoquinol methylase